MPRGTSIVIPVGCIPVDIMERNDTTDTNRRLRFVKTVNGRRVKTRVWFDTTGARRDTSENKILRSLYRKKMQEYWRTTDPLLLKQAMSMTKYANSPVPNEGACDFLEKARGAKAPWPAKTRREMAR